MHPTVKAKSAGKCPKCGMKLVAGPSHEAPAEATVAPAESSKMNIPDIELLDQSGRKIHFYTDLVKGHTVAINFIFTTCTTICPPLGATFARVQKELGKKLETCVSFPLASIQPPIRPNDSKHGARSSTPATTGPSSLGTNQRLTNCCAPSAHLPLAGKIIHRQYSLATTCTATGRVLTVWRSQASWSKSSTM